MDLLQILKILSDDTRYKIIELLSAQDLCVGALARRLEITDAAVSQHLQILRKAGLLTAKKRLLNPLCREKTRWSKWWNS